MDISNTYDMTPGQDDLNGHQRLLAAYIPRFKRGDIIGIDLDNTIICYDKAFSQLAIQQGLLPDTASFRGFSKQQVKRYLIGSGKEAAWTELQGLMYGPEIGMAVPFPNVRNWIRSALNQGLDLRIISHKTQTPYRGPAYDLHAAATDWLSSQNIVDSDMIRPTDVYFEITKEDKLKRIDTCQCDYFFDDLKDILEHEYFPLKCQGLLFGGSSEENINVIPDWHSASACLPAEYRKVAA